MRSRAPTKAENSTRIIAPLPLTSFFRRSKQKLLSAMRDGSLEEAEAHALEVRYRIIKFVSAWWPIGSL